MSTSDAKASGSKANGTSIHLSLQGKGGVGKSFIASILAQYFGQRGDKVHCIDTDPVNNTFSQYKALHVQSLPLLQDGGVDPRGFDALMDRLLNEEGTFVVDNGASTFVPLRNYMLENDVVRVLKQAGRQLYVHTVLTGGQAMLDTLHGFKTVADATPERNVIVWLNEYFGRIEFDGTPFGELTTYKENREKVFGSVLLAHRNPATFGKDLEAVISRKLTVAEAMRDARFSLMTRQRVITLQRDWFGQITALGL